MVSFSGGPDSLCLLSLIAALAADCGVRVRALHVDHGLRPESAQEAAVAADLAGRLGVACVVRRLERSAVTPGNLQQMAREGRMSLLAQEGGRIGADWLALGHTADDQAETVLLRLIRGAGPRGLGAMVPRRGRLIRPLLWARRAAISEYLEQVGLRPLQDPTNAKDAYQRNRVRHHLLPWLEQENPRIVECLVRVADNCREESAALDQLAQELLVRSLTPEGLALGSLGDQPPGLLHRVLSRYVGLVRGDLRGLQRRHLSALARLAAESEGSAELDLPGVRVRRRYDRLLLERWVGRSDRRGGGESGVVTVEGPGSWQLSGGGRLLAERRIADAAHRDELSLERFNFPFVVRAPRPGDRIAVGAGARAKVAKVLIDAKVPRAERASMVVVARDTQVLLVVGLRRAWGLAPRPGESVVRFSVVS